jgi:hypothetical protein
MVLVPHGTGLQLKQSTIQSQEKMKTKNVTTPQLPEAKLTKLIFTMLLGLTTAVFTAQAMAQGGTWTTKTPMPTARALLSAAAVDGIVYAIGGSNFGCDPVHGGSYNTVEADDPVTDTWTPTSTGANDPSPRFGHAAGRRGEALYLCLLD